MISTTEFLNCYEKECLVCKAEMDAVYTKSNKDKVAYPVACKLGWYDWFCQHSALINRTVKYGKIIRKMVKAVPELAGEGMGVKFAQRLAWSGYVDNVMVGNDEFGYCVRFNPKDYDFKFYVHRLDRSMGADFECNDLKEVYAFIMEDAVAWKNGAKTRKFGKDENWQNSERTETITA